MILNPRGSYMKQEYEEKEDELEANFKEELTEEKVIEEEELKEEWLKEEVIQEEVLKEEWLKEKVIKEEVLKDRLLKEQVESSVEVHQDLAESKQASQEILESQKVNQGGLEEKQVSQKRLEGEDTNQTVLKNEKVNQRLLKEEKRSRHKGKRSITMKVLLCTLIVIFLSVGLITGAGIVAYNSLVYDDVEVVKVERRQEASSEDALINEDKQVGQNGTSVTMPLKEEKKLDKTVAIFGTDASGRLTDVIFLAHVDSKTKEVSLIAIPRDTKVDWTKEQMSILPERHKWVRFSKINEMTSWGGIENIRVLTITTLESMLGVPIDNYVIVNLDAFRQIVDAIGGVEIDVQHYMEMRDHSQGLSISLTPGVQVLDGNKAEQFVRFRGYPNGDLGRIEAQQKFLEAFAKKVLTFDTLTKLPQLVDIAFASVKTDISLMELTTYVPYVKVFNMENLSFYVLPGEARYENNISYYFANHEKALEMIDQIFYKNIE